MSIPQPSSDESGLVFPAAAVHSEVADRGCLGVWKKRRGFIQSHHSSFTFQKPCGLPLFCTSHPLLLPGEFYYHLLYLSKFLCSSSQAALVSPLVETSTSVADLLGTCREAGPRDVRWDDCVFTCCLAWLGELCGGVWRQNGRVCEVSVWMETEAPCFPPTHTLHILTKESHSLGQMVPDSCEDRPSCTPFHSLTLSSLCHLASVFGGGLHKSWTAFPPGKWRILIEKEIRNEISRSFSGLCSVKARKCSRGKKTKCTGESVKEIGHVLKTKWKRGSMTSRPSLHYL